MGGRQAIHVHPLDAAERCIVQNDIVRVFNERGACLAGARLDDALMRGVVVMPTGAWFDANDSSLERHGNPNVLTMDRGTSRLAQGSSAHSALVEIASWSDGEPPEVRAFDAPRVSPMID